MQQLSLGIRLRDRAVFASFLPARNAEALEHLQRLAAGDGCGLTWLCGANGTGKSHLLQAVCAAAGTETRAAYLPLAQLAAHGVGVLEGLPQLECLCLDDVDRVVGQAEWERAIFALLRESQDAGARLLLAARSPPALLPWSLPDLGSRCAAATVFQLRRLDEHEQRAALELRARLRGLELPTETWQYLQRHFPRDMRTLYELLDTLDEAAFAARRRLTVPFIRGVLHALGPRAPRELSGAPGAPDTEA
jgi:DnaA-homolog protein